MKRTLSFALALGLASASPALAGELLVEPQEVMAPGPEGELSGTLIAPDGGKPVVLIIPGSGPTDRDGNNSMGITSASYRLLAEEMQRIGIGTLRIDKRGLFGSAGAVSDPNNVTIADYAEDIGAWVDIAKEHTGRECVWLLGHSEGGLIALEAAQSAQSRQKFCGLLLVASVGRPLGVILREQLEANPANAPILPQAFAAIEKLEAGERVGTASLHPGLQGLFNPAVQGFLIDMMARDPAQMIGAVDLPILIIAGGKDIQTPLADARALSAGQASADVSIIEDMNHILKPVAGDTRAQNLATYRDPALPVHTRLVQAIEAFVIAERP